MLEFVLFITSLQASLASVTVVATGTVIDDQGNPLQGITVALMYNPSYAELNRGP